MARIGILGGGFGGLAAAHELRVAGQDRHEIVLVDRAERFAMGFAKIWDLTGLRPIEEGSRALSSLERHGVRFVQTEISALDPQRHTVSTPTGTLEFDALLVALGAIDNPDQVAKIGGATPGSAHNLYDPSALASMKAALGGLTEGRLLVAVMGQPFKCPPAPFEAIMLLEEQLRSRGGRDALELTIATPAPTALPVAGPEASELVADALAERGIELRPQRVLQRIERNRATFDDGEELEFALLLAVPATAPPEVVTASPLAGKGGWIAPDPRSLRTEFERVYAVGDCTTVPTATAALPKAGIFAEAEARVAARNILADLGDGEPATFDGQGFCFLEFPERRVAHVEGNFFAQPAPDVRMTAPSEEGYRAKLEFERSRLEAWLG